MIDEVSLAAAIDQAADCIVITGIDGAIQYVNPAYTAMTGYTPGEVLGKNPRLHKSGRHSPEFYRELWDTIRSGRRWRGELTNRRKNGTLYQEEMQITPVRNTRGEIEHFIAIKQDVTRRRRDEEVIRSALDFAQSTIDALSSHICVLDRDGTVIAVNRAWREFARANRCGGPLPGRAYDADFSEGTSYLEVCDRATGAKAAEAAEAAEFAAGIRAVLGGEQEQYTAEYACHSPTERQWFLGRVTRFAGSEPVRVLIEHINITERRQAEESLLFKTALLEAQTETTIDGFLVVDEVDNIVLANQQFGAIFDIPRELLGTGNDQLVRQHVSERVVDSEAFIKRVAQLYRRPEEKSRDELN